MTHRSALRRLAKVGLALGLLAGLALAGRPLVAHAATTFTVTTNGDDAPGGSCSGSMCTTLRDAVGSAANGDSIVFASGANGTITLSNGVIAITADLTITGNGQANTLISGNSVTQIFVVGGLNSLTLANLTLEAGVGALGGDIKTFGDLTLNNVSASGGGSGTTTGGVIWAQSEGCTTMTLNSSTINGTATANGGAIFGDTINVNSSTVTGMSTSGNGGAIWADCGITITSSTVTGSTGSTGDGGAVFDTPVLGGTLTITTSTINGGTADNGGVIYFTATDPPAPSCTGTAWSITSSTLTGGNADGTDGKGGAIYNDAASLTVTTSTVSGNAAANQGGGIYNTCSLTSVSSTIANNTAPAGSGIHQGVSVAANSTLIATILNDTAATECAAGSGAITSNGYNIDDGTTCGFTSTGDQQSTSASLASLQSNGGPTQTRGLPPGSPAIAKIPLGVESACTTTDQRGVNRQQASANDNKCDVGALEVVSTTTTVTAPATAVAGTSVSITATITETVVLSGAKPTGTVSFTDNGAALGTAVSDPGTAILTTSSLPAGTQSIAAKYPGNPLFDPSGGGPAAIAVSVPVPATGALAAARANPLAELTGAALLAGGVVILSGCLRRRRRLSSRRRPQV